MKEVIDNHFDEDGLRTSVKREIEDKEIGRDIVISLIFACLVIGFLILIAWYFYDTGYGDGLLDGNRLMFKLEPGKL